MLQTRSFTIHITAPRLSASYLREPETRTLHRIGLGLALSICLHVLFFVFAPNRNVDEASSTSATKGPLVVRLSPSAKSAPPIAPEVAPPKPAPKVPTRPRPQTQMMTVPSQTPQSAMPTPEPPPPIRQPESTPTDFMSMINAKRERRAAAEAAAGARGREPSADDIAMANISRNLQSLTQKDGTNGVFQILSKGHRAAQFSFRGWTGDASNSRREVIDVDAGLNGNIDLAIIRRMIQLIRTHYQGNFNWESRRLGRVVPLSARMEDNAGLEEFMMREFFQ